MNVLMLVLGYFLYTMFLATDEKKSISGINLEKLTPLLTMFSNGNFDLNALLKSDILANFLGKDFSKIAPIVELLMSFSKGEKSEVKDSFSQAPKEENYSKFPLSPISEIADKNITYSLTKYLSQNN